MRAVVLLLLLPALAHAEPPAPVVTKAFMRELAAGKRKAADLVDPKLGILEVVYLDGEFDPPVTKSARRLCGQKAVDELAFVIRHELKLAVEHDELFRCTNRPRPSCVAGEIGEHMTNREYAFHHDPDGKLVLDTVILTMSTYKPADEARVVARLRAKHSGGGCP